MNIQRGMPASTLGHTAPISGVAAWGDFIATAGYDNRLLLWSRTEKRAVASGTHDHLVNQCDFSPDGRWLVSASSDHSARLWELPRMRLRRYLADHTDDVIRASFSPDGRLLATCSYDSTLITYRSDGSLLARCIGHSGLIETFDWTPDSRMLVSSGTDGTIRTWDAETGAQSTLRSGFAFDLDAIAILSDSSLVAGCDDGTLLVVSGDGNTTVPAHTAGVKKLVYSPGANLLVSLGYDQHAVLWRPTPNGLVVVQRTRFPDYVWARSAAFTSAGEIAFATFGSTYALWTYETESWVCDNYAPSVGVNAVMCHGDRVYSIGDAGQLRVDGVVTGGPGTLCNCLVMVAGRILAAGQMGVLYDAESGATIFAANAPINCLAAVCVGSRRALAVGTYAGEVHLLALDNLDAPNGTASTIKTVSLACNAIKGMSVCGRLLICGSADGTLSAINLDTLAIVTQVRHAHDGILNGVACVEGGFATVSRDLTLKLWSPECVLRRTIASRHENSIKSVAASPDGLLVATGSYRGTVDVFDVRGGTWIGEPVRPTMSGISSLAWHDAEHVFVAGAYDGRAYVVAI